MSNKAKASPNRFAIAPPAPEASREDDTMIRPSASRASRGGESGEYSPLTYSDVVSERQTLPDLEASAIPVIDLDDLREERTHDTIPAPTWLGDE